MCAPLYTLGPDGKPIETSSADATTVSDSSQPAQPSYSQPNASPHRIQKSSQRNGSVVVPDSIVRGLRYEAENNRLPPQGLPSTSPQEGFSITSLESPESGEDQAFLYGTKLQTSRSEASVGVRAEDDTNGTQPTAGRVQLGMMGVGGYRVGKDEMGWSGEWPSLHEQCRHEGTVSTLAQPFPHGCCSSKAILTQSLPVAPTACCSSNAKPLDGFSTTDFNGVNAVSPSCQNCQSENQPTRQPYSHVRHNGLPIPHKYSPLLLYQRPGALHPYQMDMSQTTLYTIPSSYATATHPLTPQQLAFLQQNPQLYSQTVPQHAPFGIVGQVAPPAEGMPRLVPAHNCNCGSGCECLGCAAHPFNATTRSHVQSLGALIAHGEHDSMSNVHPQPVHDVTTGHSFSVHNIPPLGPHSYDPNFPLRSSISTPNVQQPALNSNSLPPWSPPPDNGNGPVGEQVPFLSSAYYTMEIPMDPPAPHASCTDVSGSCQCGDDCACIGCLTHTGHNGIPLDVSTV